MQTVFTGAGIRAALAERGYGAGARLDQRNALAIVGDVLGISFLGYFLVQLLQRADYVLAYAFVVVLVVAIGGITYRLVWQLRSPEIWLSDGGLRLKFRDREEDISWAEVDRIVFRFRLVTVEYVRAGKITHVTRVRRLA